MRTSVDRVTLETKKHRWKEASKVGSIILGSILLCFLFAWVIGCTDKASIGEKLPEIIAFQGNPAGPNKDGSLSYIFEVKNATKIKLVEAGNTIKEINGPSSGIYKGAATGQPYNTGPTSERSPFDAVLIASNANGTVQEPLTISFQEAIDNAADFAYMRIHCCGPQYWQGQQPPGYIECPGNCWPSQVTGQIYCCYRYTCLPGCSCRTPFAAAVQGLNKKCSDIPCGVTADNITEYCYFSDPCEPGCICMQPDIATMEGLSIKCSEEPCGVADNGDMRYCYKNRCACVPGCVCLTPDEASAQGLNVKCSEDPCEVTSDNVTKYCYRVAFYCPFPCTCLTPAQASAWHFSIKCSEESCGVTADNVTKYCYRSTLLGCPYPCTCLTPDEASAQGFTVKCSDYKCGSITDNTTRYCYQDPSPCHCKGWEPGGYVYWQGSSPGKWELNCGEVLTIDWVTANTSILIATHPCSTGGCQPLPTYSCLVHPLTGPEYQIYSPDPNFLLTPHEGFSSIVLNATCGGESCPRCKFGIEVKYPPCSCKEWTSADVSWTGSPPGVLPSPCGGGITIDTVDTSQNVLVGSNPCNLEACQMPQTYSWTITPPPNGGLPVGPEDGLPASFKPTIAGTYTAVLNASCGTENCSCTTHITINNLVTPGCACQGLSVGAVVSWGGSSPGTEHGICGGAPVVIPSLTMGTPVQLTDAEAKCSNACQPPTTYSWTVTLPTGATEESGPGSTNSFSFTPTSIGSYTVLIEASCGTTSCPPCTYTIIVSNLMRSSLQMPAPVITSFTTSSTQIDAGGRVVFNWLITGEGDAFLTCGGERRSVPFTGSMAITPAQSGCCTLTASNQAGSDQSTVCITVVPPPINDPVGGCCTNGRVRQATQSQCAQIGGQWYSSLTEATQACQPPCWCCMGGKVYQATQAQCAQMGGACYTTQAEAMERCQPPCWCCANGKVYQATQSQCAQMGGVCYNDQSQATKACQQAPIPPRDMR